MTAKQVKTGPRLPLPLGEWRWVAVFAAGGVLVLPTLVYFAGLATLGPYDGGLLAFWGSFYLALSTLKPTAWLLVTGPYGLFWLLRLARRALSRKPPLP
jgi:hypothetical protein